MRFNLVGAVDGDFERHVVDLIEGDAVFLGEASAAGRGGDAADGKTLAHPFAEGANERLGGAAGA